MNAADLDTKEKYGLDDKHIENASVDFNSQYLF